MIDPQIQQVYKMLGQWLVLALVAGIILTLLTRKMDDYLWGKRYERRKEIKKKIDGKK